MPRHFLQYWKPQIADYNIRRGGPVNHSAGDQLAKVKPGDTVWIVTVRAPGKLALLGRIRVARCTGYDEALRLLDEPDIWPANHHVIARPGTEHDPINVSLQDVAGKLRFQSPTGRDRLTLRSGLVEPYQLQAMRELTPESADLLQRKFPQSTQGEESDSEHILRTRGAGRGNFKTNRQVEQAAITHVRNWYRRNGWVVRSVEQERRGYDLLCTKHAAEEHVEVKGIQGTEESFIITANEVRQAQTDTCFILQVVTRALSVHPSRSCYSGTELLARFDLKEIAYQANPKE